MPSMSDSPRLTRRIVVWLAIAGALTAAVLFAVPLYLALWAREPWMIKLVSAHFSAFVGLPSAALLSLILVIILEATFEPIDMDFRGFAHFRGASGPIVLWVFCFLATAVALKLLW